MTNARGKRAEEATLLDVLIDAYEKNEILYGFHWRQLPLPNEEAAAATLVRVRAPWFSRWWNDAASWKGDPIGPLYDWVAEEEQESRKPR